MHPSSQGPSTVLLWQVVAYLFNDYWEDIGTIKSFFEANLALAQQVIAPLTAQTASSCIPLTASHSLWT